MMNHNIQIKFDYSTTRGYHVPHSMVTQRLRQLHREIGDLKPGQVHTLEFKQFEQTSEVVVRIVSVE